ncbi:MAG: [acyl-carrier-protein] S-malonyltransferase [Desulfobacterales bacterium]|nr:MAG: [acyl-carrier-protein] S-malonyltransferase [Desulfobacterales bacterium]
MKRIAFLFPGQGSQSVGMGKDLAAASPEAAALFDQAEKITGLPLARLCFDGPMADLTQTVNLQPAVTMVNLALLALLEKKGVRPDMAAGHSLGEFSALAAAGIISPEAALRLVFRRGELMHREAVRHQGVMAAVIGAEIDAVRRICEAASSAGIVSVANHNSAAQIVITGDPAGVAAAAAMAREQKIKSVPLKVSGAWHSELIRGAENEFADVLASVSFSVPACPVYHNVTAGTAGTPEEIRDVMARQLCSPVRWYDSVIAMEKAGADCFVEVGPGKVLAGLLRKILPGERRCQIYNVTDMASLDAFVADRDEMRAGEKR